jgi:UDP-N-acetylmuramate dehydrogenase
MFETNLLNPLTISSLIQTNVSLHDKNWFKTGGAAQFYSEPTTSHQFQQSLLFAHNNQLPITLIGEGANILINDAGVEGLVIRPKLHAITSYEFDDQHCLVEVGAGVSFAQLITWCLDHQLIGLEEFSGIPGTVGGSVFINIHYFEFLLSQFLVEAQVIDRYSGHNEIVDPSWFAFSYDYSTLHQQTHYLTSATFKLKKASAIETAYARGRHDEIIRHRLKRYPQTGTCGSFFRNFHEHELLQESNKQKFIFVAYYLDKLGVKGELAVGNAIVSHQHANMIVNRGNATSDDIVMLARIMQELVYKNFNILPQSECQFIGFKNYPLLS